MTKPNDNSAATQKTRIVTANFTSILFCPQTGSHPRPSARNSRQCLPPCPAPHLPDGAVAGLEVVAAVEVVSVAPPVAEAFAGTFNFWPTTILSVVRLLAERRALTETANSLAILLRLSPDFTT